MKCHFCHKQASFFLTQIEEAEAKQLELCESCAQAKGLNQASLTISSEKPFIQDFTDLEESIPSLQENLVCPSCQFSLADLKRTQRLGCSRCYQTFADTLGGVIDKMHYGDTHVGKIISEINLK